MRLRGQKKREQTIIHKKIRKFLQRNKSNNKLGYDQINRYSLFNDVKYKGVVSIQ